MFEFHGWASVHYHAHDTDPKAQDACWAAVVGLVANAHSPHVTARRDNGIDMVLAHGQHNHRQNYVIDVFQRLATLAPGSYGLLYIRDDEDDRGGGAYANAFRVWTLRRGILTEEADKLLSPCVPQIEDEYDPARDD